MTPLAERLENKLSALAQKHGADFSVVAAAVSGGADSLALAFLLRILKEKHFLRPVLLTVNHHLRAEAAAEAEMVAKLALEWGLEHHILNWFPGNIQTGMEEKARQARYALMEDWCVQNGVRFLLTAHQQQDQAETFLMRLERGSGVDGLAAMGEFTCRGRIVLVRPLLAFSPAELRQLLQDNHIVWAEDASNRNEDFLRVRIRRFLPELERKTGITVSRLAAAASALGEVREHLECEADDFVAHRVRRYDGPAASVSPEAFAALPAETARRVLSRLIKQIGGLEYPPTFDELRRLEADLRRKNFAGATLGGCLVVPFTKRLWFVREDKNSVKISRREWENFVLKHPEYAGRVLPYPLKRLLVAAGNGG